MQRFFYCCGNAGNLKSYKINGIIDKSGCLAEINTILSLLI